MRPLKINVKQQIERTFNVIGLSNTYANPSRNIKITNFSVL